ncbi:MFS transporter [Agrococcus sp. Marseille-Q4369]|uniref:MFS transporter n=1 Tax=Agrococcus sp. Marseille-Q4369 TaxID=2810513 RepID=UPI001B8AE2DA|nr:MFS transporter [Agrococcus sp. Marseille-Q4369]QUW19921.1 MFS transporter [Agrococcus sp. Marseille-Q4369]
MSEQSTTAAGKAPDRFPTAALAVLALAVFTNISVEMLPMGLLLPMSRELGVSEGAIGLLVTIFAFTVVASSTTLIRLTRRIPRHLLVTTVLVVFGLSCFGSALAPDYAWSVAFRVIGGIVHGIFWTVVGAYAAYLVKPHQLARAVAITSAGGSFAYVLGLPLATLLGQLIGWRWSFALFGGVCLAVALAVWRLLPPVDHLRDRATTSTGSIALPDPEPGKSVRGVALAILSTTVVMLGHYALYTYVSPFLVHHAGLPESWLSGALFGYGLVGIAAVLAIALWLGKRPTAATLAMLVAGIAAMLALGLSQHVVLTVTAVLLWAFSLGALPALLQTRQLQATPERMLQQATAWYTTGFNVGIGAGALLGAFVLDSIGVGALPWALLAGLTIALVLVSSDVALHRRDLARVR